MNAPVPFNISHLPVRYRVEDYLLLDGAGAFANYAKTELIDGEVLFMNAQHRPHAYAKIELYDRLRDALRAMNSPLRAMVEASIAMPPDSVPEPDIVLTSEPRGQGPVPLGSVALVVEVSDATVAFDLERKAALYARNRVPEYWVADLPAGALHQKWAPVDGAFTQRTALPFGTSIDAMTLPGLAVSTTDL